MPGPSTSWGPRTQHQAEVLDKLKEDNPLIILAFDEAHMLTDQKVTESARWSNFSELRQALRFLHSLSCFSLFMSTTGKISQFIPAPEEDKGNTPVPLIKIVFALAARTSSLTVVKHEPTTSYNAVVYDIWCAGMSSDILNVVESSEADIWTALLQASWGWKSIYEGRGVDNDLKRSMNAGAAIDIGHWSRWAGRDKV